MLFQIHHRFCHGLCKLLSMFTLESCPASLKIVAHAFATEIMDRAGLEQVRMEEPFSGIEKGHLLLTAHCSEDELSGYLR